MKYGNTPLHRELGIRQNLLNWLPQTPDTTFAAKDAKAAKAWQVRARKVFQKCLGDQPPRVPLNPKVLETKKMDGYVRTTLTLDTAPGIKALCWLCMPNDADAARPRPAMVATPGHGMGAKDLLAMDATGQPRTEGEGYQKDYALQALRLGYPTLVVEPLGFGERRDAAMMANKTGESGCHASYTLAAMLGTSLARLRLNDLQRAIDYFEAVPGVDRKRIGLMGISGGGQMTLWTTAVEPRIKAAIVSGYLNTFRDSVMGMHHCICNFIPGLAKHFDMTDLAAMIAPRPLLIQSGTKDPIFPIKATRAAVARTREIYSVFGAADVVMDDIFAADHQWSPRKVPAFLHAALGDPLSR